MSYFLKKGFFDGAVGFHFSLLKAVYFYQIRWKIKERDERLRQAEQKRVRVKKSAPRVFAYNRVYLLITFP